MDKILLAFIALFIFTAILHAEETNTPALAKASFPRTVASAVNDMTCQTQDMFWQYKPSTAVSIKNRPGLISPPALLPVPPALLTTANLPLYSLSLEKPNIDSRCKSA